MNVVHLPGGGQVRGRALRAPADPVDLTLLLTAGPPPPWPYRRVRWPDFWVPTDTADAVAALVDLRERARAGQQVEVVCLGGRGRTGTALAALAVLDGLTPRQAVRWVRTAYHPHAVETPWQAWWLHAVRHRV